MSLILAIVAQCLALSSYGDYAAGHYPMALAMTIVGSVISFVAAATFGWQLAKAQERLSNSEKCQRTV